MVGHRIFCMLAVAALLAGCATAAQRQYQAISVNTRATAQEARSCVDRVHDTPEFAVLRRHIPPSAEFPTLEQLSDRSLATDGEIRALFEVHPKLEACRQQAIDRLAQTTPGAAAILVVADAKNLDSLNELVNKRQSWGEHAKHLKDITTEARSELAAEEARITSGLQQSHEAELARRQAAAQAAADALARYAQTQQIIANTNRPVNCLTTDLGQFKTTTCQ